MKIVFQVREVSHYGLLKYQVLPQPKTIPQNLHTILSLGKSLSDGNQVEDAQAHEAQAQQGAQAQRITRSMARALGQEDNKMALLISFVEQGCGCNKKV